jgi:hypothetical protein
MYALALGRTKTLLCIRFIYNIHSKEGPQVNPVINPTTCNTSY